MIVQVTLSCLPTHATTGSCCLITLVVLLNLKSRTNKHLSMFKNDQILIKELIYTGENICFFNQQTSLCVSTPQGTSL